MLNYIGHSHTIVTFCFSLNNLHHALMQVWILHLRQIPT